jgi:2-polyprenyl-3-methyl-5-hydroxy-6-metoxy-1,4-benzoquinol methylase
MSTKSFCIICGSEKSSKIYPGVVKCNECNYIYADLSMSQADFEALYQIGYFTGEEYSDYVADKKTAQRNFKERLKTLLGMVDTKKHQALLEVGCAYGFFLELASKHFKDVVGVDVTQEGVNYAQQVLGQKAYKVDLECWDFNQKKYDVVCMWDTIEHLRRPDIYIQKISENISTGGVIAITTGDIGSKMAEFRKNKWRLIHPPSHAHYFTRDSMTRLLEKYGFEVVHFEHAGSYRSLDLIAYNILVLRWKWNWLYRFLKFLNITSWEIYLNFYDIMYVIARKK